MRYLSVCSGIEAATVAWHSLGWEAAGFSEIEGFPRRVLQHHYPDVPLHGDFTTIGEKEYGAIDLLVGGTPCQAFSIAGLREGFTDDRGNLTLAFLQLLKTKSPKWVVWENVPGVLSHDNGRTFATFLGGLGECGYGFAYRVLDAQYFGIPQTRRRVFVVGCLGNWRSAAEVLFEPESLQGNIAEGNTKRADITPDAAQAFSAEGGRSIYFTKSNIGKGINNQTPIIAYGLKAGNINSNGWGVQEERAHTYNTRDRHAVAFGNILRRFTPLEVERLFGFPDNYTNIPGASDGERYESLGNSMAVPVMRWAGQRIQSVAGKNGKEKTTN